MGNVIGVSCFSSSAAVVVGGSAAGQGNIISGNTEKAILFQSCHNAVVQGNLIGTDVTGTLPIPNKEGIEANLSNNLKVGGTAAGGSNRQTQQLVRISHESFVGLTEAGQEKRA